MTTILDSYLAGRNRSPIKRSPAIAISSIFVALAAGFAQTPSALRERYGTADENGRYTVRPGIGMEAQYDSEGNPAEMIVKLLDDGTTPSSDKPQRRNVMRRHIALEVLDEIAFLDVSLLLSSKVNSLWAASPDMRTQDAAPIGDTTAAFEFDNAPAASRSV